MGKKSDEIAVFEGEDTLILDCGVKLEKFQIAYKTYGKLNRSKSNVVLICHALTGDQYVSETNPVTRKPGWWHHVVGPNKPIDTKKFFVICPNVLGGCMGTTGPKEIDYRTSKPYGLSFPVLTISDTVRAQEKLLNYLGIKDILCVTGGSMGGLQVLEWASKYPDRVFAAIPIAASASHSSQNIAFNEVARQAIMADPEWRSGNYIEENTRPTKGLAVARMTAHITYLSDKGLHNKFGRMLQDKEKIDFGFDADFQVESYLRHQGYTFVDRFDANSYLYLTRAMDYFDLAKDYDGNLSKAFINSKTRFFVISFSSDWLYPTSESRKIVKALNIAGANVSFTEIKSDKGHDTFLLHEPEYINVLHGYLNSIAIENKIDNDN